MENLIKKIDNWINKHRDDAIHFLQEMIQTPSPSGEEKKLAEKLASKMRELNYDSYIVDELGDVMGEIKGKNEGRSLLLNGHIDHVPVGKMVDPYSGEIIDGKLFGVDGRVVYGRAACDMKGSVAAMIMAGSALKDIEVELLGDYKVACVAQEEVGGSGTLSTIEKHHFLGDIVMIGEATNMELALGHRGSMKFSIVVTGRSCHASAPKRGINALYKAMKIIHEIRDQLIPRLPDHPLYDRTSLAITQIEVKPKALNVVPEECQFHIDCRNTPNFPADSLKSELEDIIKKISDDDQDLEAFVIPSPLLKGQRGFTGFYTDPDKFPVVQEVEEAISYTLKTKPRRKTWTFATDGRFYRWLGYPVIGFGPGEEKFAHTAMDHVKINDYLDTIKVYASIAARVCGFK